LVAFRDSRIAEVDTLSLSLLSNDQGVWFSFIRDELRQLGAESYLIAGTTVFVTDESPNTLREDLPIDKNLRGIEEVLVVGFERTGGRIMLSQKFVRDFRHCRIKYLEPVRVIKTWRSTYPALPEKW
jgi:hypothetical protein